MTTTKDKKSLFTAIQAARKEISIKATGKNQNQGWKYANIDDLYEAIDRPLENHGLSLLHERHINEEGRLILVTELTHIESGQTKTDVAYLENEKPGNQGLSAATTYMKKDAIRCLLALPSYDDDGQEEAQYITNSPKVSNNPINNEQLREIVELLQQAHNSATLHSNVLKFNKVHSLQHLPDHAFDAIRNYIIKNSQASS
jgi:hypothetical protein